MSGKRRARGSRSTSYIKRRRNGVSLEMKLNIIKRHERGEGTTQIGRVHGIAPSTVHSIVKSSPKIKEMAETASSSSVTGLTRVRNSAMQSMERLLSVWMEDQNRQNIPLPLPVIRQKARTLWNSLRAQEKVEGKGPRAQTFTASRGWFDRFMQRTNLRNLHSMDEKVSADTAAAEAFTTMLKKIIKEGGFTPKQVFNIDETGFFWKKMPSRSFIAKEEKTASGFKAGKDRLTLMLGGNAEGDVKLKPLLLYHSENPRALKGYLKPQLPVIWRSNPKGLMTVSVCQDYVINYFSNFIEKYTRESHLTNKALLLVDNAPAHPGHMEDWCYNVQVVFLPPNTTSLIQPMNQGVIAAFKAYYLKRTMKQIISETDGDNKPTIKEFWQEFNIRKALENIKDSWAELSASTMSGVWRNVWPECVHYLKDFVDLPAIRTQIVDLAKEAGFNEVDEDDVGELLESHGEDLTNDDLIQLDQQRAKENVAETPFKQLTLKNLGQILDIFERGIKFVTEQDPNLERSTTFSRTVNDALHCYKDMSSAKKKKVVQPNLRTIMQPSSSFNQPYCSTDTVTPTREESDEVQSRCRPSKRRKGVLEASNSKKDNKDGVKRRCNGPENPKSLKNPMTYVTSPKHLKEKAGSEVGSTHEGSQDVKDEDVPDHEPSTLGILASSSKAGLEVQVNASHKVPKWSKGILKTSAASEKSPMEVIQKEFFGKTGCGCSKIYGQGNPCSQVIRLVPAIQYREHCRGMEKKVLESAVKMQLMAHRRAGPVTDGKGHKTKLRERPYQAYYFQSHQICRKTFAFLHGFHVQTLKTISKSLDDDGLDARTHGNTKRLPKHNLS
uniref:tigger transposable element-derived protein 1-like isoform X2 n=1 Tax=Myxine glutinosa TaxID=7769 RepID=UPI00358DF661